MKERIAPEITVYPLGNMNAKIHINLRCILCLVLISSLNVYAQNGDHGKQHIC